MRTYLPFHSRPDSPLSALKTGIQQYHVLVILLLALAVRLPLVFTPITYTDSWRQADTASIAHNFYRDGGNFNILYPQINWGGNVPGYVEAEFQLYTFVVAILYRVFGEHIILGRLVSLALTLPTLGLFYLLVRRMFNRRIAAWALLIFAISPLSIRYSTAFMPEAAVMFFYVAALYTFYRWLTEEKSHFLWWAAVSTALAVLVKPTSIHIGVIFLLLLLARCRLRFLGIKALWGFAAVALIPTVLYYLHAYTLYQMYGNTFGLLAGGDTKFGGLRDILSAGFYLRLVSLDSLWLLALGGVPLALFGTVLLLRQKDATRLPLFGAATALIYYMLVSRFAQEEWGIHYHIYTIPYATALAAIGADWLWNRARQPDRGLNLYRLAVVAAFGVMVVLAGRIYSGSFLRHSAQDILQCAASVEQIVPAERRIIVSSTSASSDNGLANNYQDPRLFYYSQRYGWSLAADDHTPERVEQFREDGAAYLVIYDPGLYTGSPALAAYLERGAQQVGPGIEAGCAIFQFDTSG
jgi:4-amino-4-deoxy-L-arabinose transferase-like glycosyltransferase